MGVPQQTGKPHPWLLAALFVAAVFGVTFHEGLLGTAAIDAAAYLPYEEPLYGGPLPHPSVQRQDASPELLYQPWDTFILRCLHGGELPLWLAANGAGAPLLANGQSGALDPLKALVLGAGPAVGTREAWFLVLRPLLAAWGMLALAHRLRLSATAGVLAALAFSLSGFWLYHLHFADTHGLVYLPWLLWAALGLVARPRYASAALLGGLTGLAGLVGHPETALFSAAAAYLLAMGLLGRERRGWWALAGAALLGLLVAGAAVLPFVSFLRESQSYLYDREHSAFSGVSYMLGFGKALGLLRTHLIAPDGWGLAAFFNPFVGAVALALAPLGLPNRAVRAPVLALAALWAGAFLLFPPSAPVALLPVAPNAYYATPLASLALALLAGAGLDRLLEGKASWPAAVIALLLLGRAGLDFRHLANAASASYVPFMLAAALCALVCLATARRFPAPSRALLTLAAACELGLAARVAIPPLPACNYPPTPLTRFLQAHAAGARIDGEAPACDAQAMFGLEAFGVSDAFINRRFFRFYQALHERPSGIGNLLTLKPGFRPALLDLANVRYVVAKPGPLASAAAAAGYPAVCRDGTLTAFENPQAMPRAWVAYAADAAQPDAEAAGRRLAASPERFRRRVLLEGPLPRGWQDQDLPTTAAAITARSANSVGVAFTAARPGILVLAETYTDGWQAELDGSPVTLFPADVLFRGVPVPAGPHAVTFRYRPRAVAWGLAATLLGLLLCLGALLPRRKPAAAG